MGEGVNEYEIVGEGEREREVVVSCYYVIEWFFHVFFVIKRISGSHADDLIFPTQYKRRVELYQQ